MTPNFWIMKMPLLEMDKTFKRDTFEEDIKSSVSDMFKCTESERGLVLVCNFGVVGMWLAFKTRRLDEII